MGNGGSDSGTSVGTSGGSGPPRSSGGSTGSSVRVPEPATLALLSLGLLGCAVRARRR